MSDKQPRLEDRYEIEANLFNYARGVDRRDWPLVESCYHADAFDNHGAYRGGVEGLIKWMRERHAGVSFSMHMISNILIEFQGQDLAVSEAYCVTWQRTEGGSDALRMYGVDPNDPIEAWESEVRCRFVDKVLRRGGVWRISERTVVFETFRLTPIDRETPFEVEWATGTRDREDVLYKALSDVSE